MYAHGQTEYCPPTRRKIPAWLWADVVRCGGVLTLGLLLVEAPGATMHSPHILCKRITAFLAAPFSSPVDGDFPHLTYPASEHSPFQQPPSSGLSCQWHNGPTCSTGQWARCSSWITSALDRTTVSHFTDQGAPACLRELEHCYNFRIYSTSFLLRPLNL